MKTRYWILGGLGVLAIAAMFGSGPSPAALCSRADTLAALNDAFVSKLAKFGGKLSGEYAVHGRQGQAIVCSAAFSVGPIKKDTIEQVGQNPRSVTDVQTIAMFTALLPSLLVQEQAHPGQPLTMRLTYSVTPTADDEVLVTVIDFPGASELR